MCERIHSLLQSTLTCEPFVFGPALAMLTVYGLKQDHVSIELILYELRVQPIVLELTRELILELPSPDRVPTSTIPKRVTRLDHEVL